MIRSDKPLGKILHIVNKQAICRPKEPFKGKGAIVVLINQKKIGTLGDPFGPVDRPYQPINLDNPNDTSIIGKLAVAQGKHRKNKSHMR